jgi:diguanylate cyclase (GGDEF)-like protein/PAS domain S-box-containing protein
MISFASLDAAPALLDSVMRSTLDGVIVVDTAGRVLSVNRRFINLWRLPEPAAASVSAMLRRIVRQLADRRRHAAHVRALAADPCAAVHTLLECTDGRAFELFAEPYLADGAAWRVWSVADVTESRMAERELRESEERYALALRGANDGFWDWRPGSGTLFVSARWCEMVGMPATDVTIRVAEWFDRVHPGDRARVRLTMQAHLAGEREHLEMEYRVRHADGAWRWVLVRGAAVRDARGRAVRMAGSTTDVTERRAAQERVAHDAVHDTLTGLPNRTLLADRLDIALRRARAGRDRVRGVRHVGVLLVGLDRFDDAVRARGRPVEDAVLRAVAGRLQGCLRPGDTVARVGPDQFMVLVDDLAARGDALRLADRLRAALGPAFAVGAAEPVYLTASIGIAVSGGGAEDGEALLGGAWTALLRARGLGGGQVEMYDREMQARAAALRRMEAELRGALSQDRIAVAFQPVVSLADGRVRGFEALARLRTADGREVPPGEFIPLAEETGLIGEVGRRVLRTACERMADWQRRYPTAQPRVMSVNLSPRQLADPALPRDVAAVLAETGLAPGALRLELTESVLAGDVDAVAATLGELKRVGVSIAIDDFGIGYSSLAYLHRFPLDALKVDRSFVAALGEGPGEEIVRAIVSLARGLGLEAVAEGVETAEQRDRLAALGCPCAQGFLFARPLPADAAEALLAAEPPPERVRQKVPALAVFG